MATSRTAQNLARRHQANKLLRAQLPHPMPSNIALDLSIDQPPSFLDYEMVENARQALEAGQTHYVDVPGIAPLREALAAYLVETGVTGYGASELLVSAGIQEARFLALQMMAGLGGEVAVPDVVHPGVLKAIGVRSLKVRSLPTARERGHLPTVASLREALQGGVRLVYLESPSRLTGAIYSPEEVQEIGQLVREYDARVIWDQGLAPWVTGRHYLSLGAVSDLADRVVLIGEAWPGTGLDSLMIGYVAAHEEWLAPIRSQKQIMSICTSTPSQYAALKSPVVYQALHAAQVALLGAIRERAAAVAGQLGAEVLEGSSVNLLALAPADAAVAKSRLDAAGFRFADGADFGAPGVVRLAITPDNAVARALCHLA